MDTLTIAAARLASRAATRGIRPLSPEGLGNSGNRSDEGCHGGEEIEVKHVMDLRVEPSDARTAECHRSEPRWSKSPDQWDLSNRWSDPGLGENGVVDTRDR